MEVKDLELGEIYSVKFDFQSVSCNYVFCCEFSEVNDGVFDTFYMFARHDTRFRNDIVFSLIRYLTADEVREYVKEI